MGPGASERIEGERSSKRPWAAALGFALMSVLPVDPLAPAVITVEGDCSLVEAIRAANDDAPEGGCPAGSGPDTLVLTADVTLLAVEEVFFGGNGLPTVTSEITIDGRNHEIERLPDALEEFRIVAIDADPDARLTLDRVTVTGGHAEQGGGAFLLLGGVLTLRNSTVTFNHAGQVGGAIWAPGGSLYSYRTVFSSNNARTPSGVLGNGGALHLAGYTRLEETTLSYNAAGGLLSSPDYAFGGAVYNGGETVISNSTLSGNSAVGSQAEGGSAIFNLSLGSLTLINTTVSGNGGESSAGAVHNGCGGAVASLEHVTLSGNDGHALVNCDTSSLSSMASIIANTAGDNCSGPITDDFNNVADDDTCGTIPSGLTGLDPVLADNGGATRTHALEAGSNAIDAAGFCDVPTDQRGAPRIGACDIGAFEFMGCPVLSLADETIATAETYEECAVSAGPDLAVVGPGGDLTLRFGTTASFANGVSIGADAALTVVHDPSLQLLLPELIEADRARRRALAQDQHRAPHG